MGNCTKPSMKDKTQKVGMFFSLHFLKFFSLELFRSIVLFLNLEAFYALEYLKEYKDVLQRWVTFSFWKK